MKTTVAIPLHRSAGWVETIAGNLERLAPVAKLVVSDVAEEDDALDRLKQRFVGRDIEWIGRRELESGWVAHCNDLLARAETDYFMWLPHDDDVDADWVIAAEHALEDDAVILALGDVEVELVAGAQGPEAARLRVDPRLADSDPVVRVGAAIDLLVTGDTSLLGVAFRGIMRRRFAVPLPDVDGRGSWADVLWVTRMSSRGSIVTVDASYRKRWHAGNTHSAWAYLRADPEFRSRLIPAMVDGLPADLRASVIGAAWTRELESPNSDAARAELALRESLGARDRTIDELRRSTSWRVTAPLRTAAGIFARLRGADHDRTASLNP